MCLYSTDYIPSKEYQWGWKVKDCNVRKQIVPIQSSSDTTFAYLTVRSASIGIHSCSVQLNTTKWEHLRKVASLLPSWHILAEMWILIFNGAETQMNNPPESWWIKIYFHFFKVIIQKHQICIIRKREQPLPRGMLCSSNTITLPSSFVNHREHSDG